MYSVNSHVRSLVTPSCITQSGFPCFQDTGSIFKHSETLHKTQKWRYNYVSWYPVSLVKCKTVVMKFESLNTYSSLPLNQYHVLPKLIAISCLDGHTCSEPSVTLCDSMCQCQLLSESSWKWLVVRWNVCLY